MTRKIVPVWWCSCQPWAASCSTHPVPLLFRYTQFFSNNLPNTALFHVQLIYDHSNNQLMTTTHLLPYLLDVDHSPACRRSPAPGLSFTSSWPSLNFLCYSKTLVHNKVLFPYPCWNISSTCDSFPQPEHCPVGWGCRIHWMHLLCRGVRHAPPQWMSWIRH